MAVKRNELVRPKAVTVVMGTAGLYSLYRSCHEITFQRGHNAHLEPNMYAVLVFTCIARFAVIG